MTITEEILAAKNKGKQFRTSLLEKAVMTADTKELEEVCEIMMPWEFTARALGIACRFRGMEYVRLLLKYGAKFNFETSIPGKRMFSNYLKECSVIYPYKYELWLLSSPDGKYNDFNSLKEYAGAEILPAEKRAEITAFLSENKDCGFDKGVLFYYSLYDTDKEITDAMNISDKEIKNNSCLDQLSETHYAMPLRYEFIDMLYKSKPAQREIILNAFEDALERAGKKLVLPKSFFESSGDFYYIITSDENAFANIVRRADCSKMSYVQLAHMAADLNSPKALQAVIDAGFIDQPSKRDALIEYASLHKKIDSLSFLLEYKEKTADRAKEEEAAEKKLMRELNMSPFSMEAMKRVWSWDKLPDDTLILKSYKGKDEEITVPAKIGKYPVTVLGKELFDPQKRGASNSKTRENIRRVTISEGINKICEYAFRDCKCITEINIPESVSEIGYGAFEGCTHLGSIVLPPKLTVIEHSLFYYCRSLKSIVIPEGVKEIRGSAFSCCEELERAVIPNSVEKIESRAFYHCDKLKSIEIPEGLTNMRSDVFERSEFEKKLTDENNGFFIINGVLLKYYGKKEDIIIPRGVEIIAEDAFTYDKKIKTVTIPAGVKKLESNAFKSCSALKSVKVLGMNTKFGYSAISCGYGKKFVMYAPKGSEAEKYSEFDYYSIFIKSEEK